ncbi:MAG: hypothetical protein HQL43_13915 [Alphaproteobacteria bacterium]|nr:hypothetical protein [Alphaproteobacteria bacterium]
MSCSNCRFWGSAPLQAGQDFLETPYGRQNWAMCRVHPPVVTDSDRRRVWPITRYDDWCGEFGLRAEEENG